MIYYYDLQKIASCHLAYKIWHILCEDVILLEILRVHQERENKFSV